MIKAKVETIAQLMGETDQKVKLEVSSNHSIIKDLLLIWYVLFNFQRLSFAGRSSTESAYQPKLHRGLCKLYL